MILSYDVKNVKALGLLKTASDKRQRLWLANDKRKEQRKKLSRGHLRLPLSAFSLPCLSYLIKRFRNTVTANMPAKRQVVPRDQVFPMFMIFALSISSTKIKDDCFHRLCHAISGCLALSGLFLGRNYLVYLRLLNMADIRNTKLPRPTRVNRTISHLMNGCVSSMISFNPLSNYPHVSK